MKKIVPILALAAIAAFASCKKEYSCTCSYKATGIDTTIKHDLGKQKKSDAESSCDKYETDLNAAWGPLGGSGSCSL